MKSIATRVRQAFSHSPSHWARFDFFLSLPPTPPALALTVSVQPLPQLLRLIETVTARIVTAIVTVVVQAWEFFLLRPTWYLWVMRWTEMRRHDAAVKALQEAVLDLLVRATGSDGSALSGAYGGDAAKLTTQHVASTRPQFLKAIMEHLQDGRYISKVNE